MAESDDPVVWVRRQWDSQKQAAVRLGTLDGLHWVWLSGGVRAPTPRPFMHAYITCDAVIDGDLDHSCRHGSGPHRIKVCIVQRDNTKRVRARLLALAGQPPPE